MVWLRWCSCGGVFVAVFLWWCSCGGVQNTTPVLQSTTPYYKVLVQYYSVLQSTTPSVLQSTTPVLQSTTSHNKVILQYYSVLHSTTPVLLRTTKYYSSTTPYYKVLLQYYSNTTLYYKVLLQYYSVLQSTTPTSETTSERRPSSTTPLPKGSFRARLRPNFTEQASKTSVLRDASDNFHRTSFQNERFARCFRQFSPKICVSPQFRAIDTPIPARGFIRQKQNVPRTTTACHPKFQNARFATAACAKMYESIDGEPTRFAHTKM